MVGSLGLLQSRLRRARTGGLHFDTGKRNPKLEKCSGNHFIGIKNATVLRYQFAYRFCSKNAFWGQRARAPWRANAANCSLQPRTHAKWQQTWNRTRGRMNAGCPHEPRASPSWVTRHAKTRRSSHLLKGRADRSRRGRIINTRHEPLLRSACCLQELLSMKNRNFQRCKLYHSMPESNTKRHYSTDS